MPPDETSRPQSTQNRPPHEALLLQLRDQEFQLWRHNPLTAAYLLYLKDQAEAFRTAAADLLEAGRLAEQADTLRGRILTLRELESLTLEAIQNFYRQEDNPEGNDATTSDQGNSR